MAVVLRTTTSAGSALLTQASPLWRPHNRIQCVFWRIGPEPQPLFYSACSAMIQSSSFQISAKLEESRLFQYEPQNIGTDSLLQAPTRFSVGGTVCRSPMISHPSIPPHTLNYTAHFYIRSDPVLTPKRSKQLIMSSRLLSHSKTPWK